MSDNSSNPQRGQYDPGWNDPPKLQYNSSSANNQTGKFKLNLNKRIAFPLQTSSTVNTSKPTAIVQPSPSLLPLSTLNSTNTQSITSLQSSVTQPPIAIVPPMPQINQSLASPSSSMLHRVPPVDSASSLLANNRINQQQQNENDDSSIELNENSREYCLNVFQRFISTIQESTNVRSDEVQRRINLMNQMWLSGILTLSVQRKLIKIAEALEANNFNDAIENHRALVVDHSNICAAWGAALRQIILTIQQHDVGSLNAQQQQHIISGNNILIPTTTVVSASTTATAAVGTTLTGDNNRTTATTTVNQLQNESSNNIQHI